MLKRKHFKQLFNVLVVALLLVIPSLHVSGQANLDKKAAIAKNRLINKHNEKGTWWTFYNFDTVPENLKRSKNFFIGMLIADLLEPYRTDTQIDSVVKIALNLSYQNINPENGFLKYYDRYDDLPEETDVTSLFWCLNQKVDTGFVSIVIDSL